MATKATAATGQHLHGVPTQDIELKIEGMIELHDRPNTFRLEGVPMVEPIDYAVIQEMLESRGLDRMWAGLLIEEFAQRVGEVQIARVIAQRTTRVG